MSFFKFLRNFLPPAPPDKLTFQVDPGILTPLEELAAMHRRTKGQLIYDLVTDAMAEQERATELVQIWGRLTMRQADVAACICLGLNNREIAERLVISVETVKSHVQQVFRKFDVHSKEELRRLLTKWDFSAWEHRLR